MKTPNIRRCLNCLAKTPQMFWTEETCPVCEMVMGYKESHHGGLNLEQIEELKKERAEVEKRLKIYSSPERVRI